MFIIRLHKRDRAVLELIKSSLLDVGSITDQDDKATTFRVGSIDKLEVIINHFDKYPLITQKLADYLLFRQAFELIKNKEHLTPEGLNKLVSIRASMNKGLSDHLKVALPYVTLAQRPLVKLPLQIERQWLAGFAEGEACFSITINTSKSHKLGFVVYLRFRITQHSRDVLLIDSLVNSFGCGKVEQDPRGSAVTFVVQKISDITEKIIPFFDKYPLQGIKAKDFEDFKKAANLMQSKAHLTKEGLEQIRIIKSGMNTQRNII
jgi:LAGLIDADG endonuclease